VKEATLATPTSATSDANAVFTNASSRKSATFKTGESLDKIIYVTTLCSNPDGKAGMRRVNRYALDMNRDVVFSTQPETISLTKDIAKWDPILLNEWHGYVGNMLIEPCTAPHAPTFEYDLLQNNMIELAMESGRAILGSTGYNEFHIPWDHSYGGNWDDGGTIYAPMFAMLFGTYGYTVEFPHSNADSFDAGNVMNYAMLNSLMSGKTKYYANNGLNGKLPIGDTTATELADDHSADNVYPDMRKSSVMNKLNVKLRGVENIDAKATVDKYFIDQVGGQDGNYKVVGRVRQDDPASTATPKAKLNFFPDYIVIPTDSNQYNVSEGIKGVNHMISLGCKVSISTQDITYKGKTVKAGAYVMDMRQGNRNLIAEIMGKGYDATNFPSMYADIYCNYPDVRGFDSVEIWGKELFKNKLQALTGFVEKTEKISGTQTSGGYVTFKSQSTDAVRFVNLLLSGKSAGPSKSNKGPVWMLRKDVAGVGKASDYVIKNEDLFKMYNLKDNMDLGLKGCQIEGKYIAKLPVEAVALVEPIIQFNTARTAQTGGVLWWALDEYLGFASLAQDAVDADGAGYNGSTTFRKGANVVVSNNANPAADIISAVKKDGLGLVLIQNASALNYTNFGLETADSNKFSAPTSAALQDIALNGKYNVDNSLFTANYANTETIYARGASYNKADLPLGSKVLFETKAVGEEAFIGGFQPTTGLKDAFKDRTLMFSTILRPDGKYGKPVQSITIGQSMATRSHYQKLMPLLATSIFAGAAGIYDDFNAPTIADKEVTGNKFLITLNEPVGESGFKTATAASWNGSKYVTETSDNNGGELLFGIDASKNQKFKIDATDYAGNAMTSKYLYYSASSKTLADFVAVTGVKLNKTSATVARGKTLQLTAAIAPASASDKAVTWKSSNTKYATVSATGKVVISKKAKKGATVTITCTAKDGSNKVGTCKIKIK
ncbi:MAG: Ig-like domain-containing protein, partial [Anaerovoracaceae bacterium]